MTDSEIVRVIHRSRSRHDVEVTSHSAKDVAEITRLTQVLSYAAAWAATVAEDLTEHKRTARQQIQRHLAFSENLLRAINGEPIEQDRHVSDAASLGQAVADLQSALEPHER